MKRYRITSILSILLISVSVRANVKFEFLFQHPTSEKEFKYQAAATEQDYEVVFEKASFECFGYFKNKNQIISNEEASDIIDTCANPIVKTVKQN